MKPDKGEFIARPDRPSDVAGKERRHFLARPAIAWILSFGSVAIGGILAVWPAEIRDATRRALQGPRDELNIWVGLFWLGSLIWGYVLYRRLKTEHQTENARVTDLLR